MKTKQTLIAVAALTVLTAGVTVAQNDQPTQGRRGTPADREAMKAEHERIVSIYDENGDGVLDDVEREVLHEDVQAGKIAPPRRGPGQGGQAGPGGRAPGGRMGPPPEIVSQYDADGDGVLNQAERNALKGDVDAGVIDAPRPPRAGGAGRKGPPPEILGQYDADGNGRLSTEEHAAVRADIEAGKLTPPAAGPGRGGPRPGGPAGGRSGGPRG